jgi:acyl-CoA thioester hydrolase
MAAFVSFRSTVDPSDCDFLGHMNVSRYFAACSDGVLALQSALGLTAEDMRSGRRLSFAVVHAESDFLAELRAGDAIWLESAVLEIGSKSMTFEHKLYVEPDRRIAFASRFKCVMLDLAERRSALVPDDVCKKASAFVAD